MLTSEDEAALRAFLEELQPFDVATALPELALPQQLHLLAALPPNIAAETLEHLDPDEQYGLLTKLDPGNARDILTTMSDDALADLVGAVHPREAAHLLRHVPEKDLAQVRQLMAYPETSAGGRMTTGYFSARRAWTPPQVIEHFRRVGQEVEVAHYVYVVDRHGNLVGVTSLRDVLLTDPQTPLSEIMHEKVVSVYPEEDQEVAARLLGQYDFGALPVVRADGKMLGVVTADDVYDVAEEEATEDIQKSAAVEPLETSYSRAGLWTLYRSRIGWLAGLVLLNLVSGGVIIAFESTLSRAIALAPFIPLLIGTGGNTGSQSATLMIRAIATGDLRLGDWLVAVLKESGVGITMGFTLGILSGALGIFRGGWEIGLVVGLTMVVVVLVANLVGTAMPFLLSLFRMDPAVASSPLIATVMDATGLLTYFAIASFVLSP
jgi:magnesium transporter